MHDLTCRAVHSVALHDESGPGSEAMGKIIPVILVILGLASESTRAEITFTADVLVQGSAMKGVHGLAFDNDGVLHAVSITGMSTYRIDVETGAVETVIGPPSGVGDDLAFAPDGSLAWTARDAVHVQSPDGDISVLVDGIDGVNSISYGPDGRLFYTLIFRADALYEAYPGSDKEPRLIAEGMGGLNGFEVTPDGKIIGPLFFGNAIVSVDVETGEIERLAEGIQTPAAVNLLSNGDIIALGYRTGKVFRIDAETKEMLEIAQLEGAPIDNLAISKDDRIFISHSSHNGLTELNPETGETRRILWGELSAPGGLAVVEGEGRDLLMAADAWGHRAIDLITGEVTVPRTAPTVFGSTAIAVDENRFITSNVWPNGFVQIIDPDAGTAAGNVFGLGAPYGVLGAPDDGILIADYAADTLISVSGEEGLPRTVIAKNLGGPVGLTRAGGDAVYVTGHADGTVSWVDLADGTRTVVASGLDEPEGIARLPSGLLVVAEVGQRRVVLVDPGSGDISAIAEDLPLGFDLGGGGHPPALLTGVAATSDGTVYVTGDADNSLIRLRPE
jgi:streptogramin lyase